MVRTGTAELVIWWEGEGGAHDPERDEKRAERVALEQDRAAALQAKMLREAPIIEACKGAGIELKEGKAVRVSAMKALLNQGEEPGCQDLTASRTIGHCTLARS